MLLHDALRMNPIAKAMEVTTIRKIKYIQESMSKFNRPDTISLNVLSLLT